MGKKEEEEMGTGTPVDGKKSVCRMYEGRRYTRRKLHVFIYLTHNFSTT
jgi:hypothetical protein